jgi:hypothetical protein
MVGDAVVLLRGLDWRVVRMGDVERFRYGLFDRHRVRCTVSLDRHWLDHLGLLSTKAAKTLP